MVVYLLLWTIDFIPLINFTDIKPLKLIDFIAFIIFYIPILYHYKIPI